MNIVANLSNQYLASLRMLENNVSACPEPLWLDKTYPNPFWQVAYHVLFYTHLYLSPDEASFQTWVLYRDRYHRLEHSLNPLDQPYTRQEILEYLHICQQEVLVKLPHLDLEGPSGFEWLAMNKFELQIYNIRHIMQHTGELSDRLGSRYAIDVNWVSGDEE